MGTLWLPAGSKVPQGMRRNWAAYRPSLPDPVGSWELNEGSGSLVNDSSGNGNTGTLTNGPLWVPTPRGVGLDFDRGGSINQVLFPQALVGQILTQFSVHLQFVMDSVSAVNNVLWALENGATATTRHSLIYIDASESIRFSLGNGTTVAGDISSGAALAVGAWHTATATFGANIVRTYVDAVRYDVDRALTGPLLTVTRQPTIGARNDTSPATLPADAKISKLFVWGQELTASQVAALEGPVPVYVRQMYWEVGGAPQSVTATTADATLAGVEATAANQSPLSATAGTADAALAGVQASAANQSALAATATTADLTAAAVQAEAANQSALSVTATTADLAAAGVQATAANQDALAATATTAEAVLAGVDASAVVELPAQSVTATTADLVAAAVDAIAVVEDDLEATAGTANLIAAGVDAIAALAAPDVLRLFTIRALGPRFRSESRRARFTVETLKGA